MFVFAEPLPTIVSVCDGDPVIWRSLPVVSVKTPLTAKVIALLPPAAFAAPIA